MIALITTLLPEIVALIRSRRPSGAPELTYEEVIAALHSAVADVVTKGDAWKAEHPE